MAGAVMTQMPLWQSRFVVPSAAVELFLAEFEDAVLSDPGWRSRGEAAAMARSGGSS